MTAALATGTIGWGVIAFGAVAHLRHPDRLVDLLRIHTPHAPRAAWALITIEVAVAALIAVGLAFGLVAVRQLGASAGLLLGAAFTAWVLRLWLSGSDLPCACSWSSAPTSVWSVVRAAAVMLSGLLIIGLSVDTASGVAALCVGAAMGAAAFLLPDALAWPEESARLRDFARTEGAPQ